MDTPLKGCPDVQRVLGLIKLIGLRRSEYFIDINFGVQNSLIFPDL
jgi:hypothetical protein